MFCVPNSLASRIARAGCQGRPKRYKRSRTHPRLRRSFITLLPSVWILRRGGNRRLQLNPHQWASRRTLTFWIIEPPLPVDSWVLTEVVLIFTATFTSGLLDPATQQPSSTPAELDYPPSECGSLGQRWKQTITAQPSPVVIQVTLTFW